MTTNAADALERLERTVTDMRAEARDASEDGEDMSVMREWANDIAKSIRSLRKVLADRQGEAVAWRWDHPTFTRYVTLENDYPAVHVPGWRVTPLYTHPAPAAVTDGLMVADGSMSVDQLIDAVIDLYPGTRRPALTIFALGMTKQARTTVTDAAKVQAWEDAFEHCRKVYKRNKSRLWVLTCLRDQYNGALTAALQIGGE